MEKHDVVIVGAGPGGLTAARELAKKNKDVLVLEKKPEEKMGDRVCNGIFHWNNGYEKNIIPESVYRKIVPVIGAVHGRKHDMDMFPKAKNGLIIIDPKRLVQWQLKEARKFGAEIRDQSPVLKVKKKEDKVILKDGREIGYDHLIGADGPRSKVVKSLGLERRPILCGVSYIVDERSDEYIDYYSPKFWEIRDLWSSPDEGEKTCYSTFYKLYNSHHPADRSFPAFCEYFEKWLREERGLSSEVVKDAVRKSVVMPQHWHGFKHGNIFLVGDAAPFFDAYAATGTYNAIKSGEFATRAILGMSYKKEVKKLHLMFCRGSPRWMTLLIPLLDQNLNENVITKMVEKINSSRLGRLALRYELKFTKKIFKYSPGLFVYSQYLASLYAPTVKTSYDSMEGDVNRVYCTLDEFYEDL